MVESAEQVAAEVNVRRPGPPKRLIFCFDGTWNRLDAATPTNVVLTAESVVPVDSDDKAQVLFYDEGVGTGRFDRLRGGVLGMGIVDKLGDAYRFLTFNYSPGDELYVFGFSRGAFTARSFVGMLRNCGIVSRSKAGRIKEAVERYRSRDPDLGPDTLESRKFRADVSGSVCVDEAEDAWRVGNVPGYVAGSAPLLKVHYLGVWDTVGALGVPTRYRLLGFFNRKLQFHDTMLSSIVENGRHAVAIDERRKDFAPTIWSNVDERNESVGADPGSNLAPYQERWFPGVHCGVGGGGDLRGLSDQALSWIWEGAQAAGLELDGKPGSRIFELEPNFCAPLSPFSLHRLGWFARLKDRAMELLWRKADRVGPTLVRNVSPFARRRWKAPATSLPERILYRPATLKEVGHQLDALPDEPAAPAADTFDTIRVMPRDTLSGIAKQRLGDAKRSNEIFEMNLDVLDDPEHIYPGMVLRVPK